MPAFFMSFLIMVAKVLNQLYTQSKHMLESELLPIGNTIREGSMLIKVLCNPQSATILWCSNDGCAYEHCTSPADIDSIALNLAAWKGRALHIDGPHATQVKAVATHLQQQGHSIPVMPTLSDCYQL
jgi:hypothetical protein